MNWIMSANGNKYDHEGSFSKWGFIDWKQGNIKFNIGDTVYIYCTKPIRKLMYKTVVININCNKDNIVDDYEFWKDEQNYRLDDNDRFIRLQLISYIDNDGLTLENLKVNGLVVAPQKPQKIRETLLNYIDKFFDNECNLLNEYLSDSQDILIEGNKNVFLSSRYERNPIARSKCIEKLGCVCMVCGFDFEKKYGAIGKNYIHVHHIVPLSCIQESYVVNPISDLVPVCPNCHAMLHRKIDATVLSVEKLKNLIESKTSI